jgi:3-oxoacyl-[acyl-carrier protein] reductase
MEKRVALITGGARGIGRAVGVHLGSSGWAVAFGYRASTRTNPSEVAAARLEIEEAGGPALAIEADVSDPADGRRMVDEVLDKWGRIDALVNAAGPYHRVNVLDETVEGWREMFATNLDPVFYLSQAVIPGMIERKWGRIVNFSMATADQLTAQPGITAHYIAKAGVLVLTRTLARVVAQHGITVNAISPGFIDSGGTPKEEMEQMFKRIPVGYIGELSDAVNVVRFLLSDEARYVNGANIHLSGGWGL